MKNKTKILIAFGMVSALIIGFMIGVVVNYPKIDISSASGTIGKIKNYRNIKVSDASLKLYNDLISDTTKLKKIKNYYNFQYLTALKLSANIGNAIKEANAVSAFKEKNLNTINNLADYETFLLSARTDLLLAISAINAVKTTDPALYMIVSNQANNVIVQMNYKNKGIIRFIEDVSTFVTENPSVDCAGLKKIHDVLSISEVFNSAIIGDKVMLKYFDKKPLLGNNEELQACDQTQLKNNMQHDFEMLNIIFPCDRENLGNLDKESLNAIYKDVAVLNDAIFDMEKLGIEDSEKLGLKFTDSEKLGRFCDSEKLGRYNDVELLDFPVIV
jgi:hypothetical protein